jgi:hypothetical protein
VVRAEHALRHVLTEIEQQDWAEPEVGDISSRPGPAGTGGGINSGHSEQCAVLCVNSVVCAALFLGRKVVKKPEA